VAFIPGQIAARLYFDEMMRVALPLTPWWRETYLIFRKLQASYSSSGGAASWKGFPQRTDDRIRDLTDGLMFMRRQILEDKTIRSADGGAGKNCIDLKDDDRQKYISRIPVDFLWLVRLAGTVGNAFENGHALLDSRDELGLALEDDFIARGLYPPDEYESRKKRRKSQSTRDIREMISEAFTRIYKHWSDDDGQPDEDKYFIWRITQNRPVQIAVSKSALTVKADAARRLFDVSCGGITWAVVDSGIDHEHPAFRDHSVEVLKGSYVDSSSNIQLPKSRVIKTLDFTNIRELLDYDIRSDDGDDDGPLADTAEYEKLIDDLVSRMPEPQRNRDDAVEQVALLRERIKRQRDVDWEDLEPLIVNQNPKRPPNDHGTHVAGILGADWIDDVPGEDHLPPNTRKRRMQGVCPDINLIDVRVFRDDGRTDEFELLAAMQFLRWMNSRAGYMVCHGANLSLSLIHEVRRFACGKTPICDECNEAVALGMVVVVAAGNRGFEADDLNQLVASDGYRPVSITDPGNAKNVITVGATHRKRPHDYGVSYFSSRGPTGDGRLKPDLVAPGEKIKGPTPDGGEEFKDGTSMAAPHVSGAAAMLMARHSELVGHPLRIKQILCETATDLERERYFQGHGLLDILRALQSI
jgi:hypothetical protein